MMNKERARQCARVAVDLRATASALVRRLRIESEDCALSMSQSAVLTRLHNSGPSTVADLARAEHLTPQSMGATVAALEKEGLVARKVRPDDARRWNASLTKAGRRSALAGRNERQDWLARAVGERLDDAELRRLQAAIALVRKVLGE